MKLTFLGDIMCTEGMLEAFSQQGRFDFSTLFTSVKPLLDKSDYVFANLETPISMTNTNLTHERYCFCSPYEFARAVKDASIDFVSTANNHCLDRGYNGLKDTVEALNKIGLSHTGVFTAKSRRDPSIIDVKGLKIGIAAYTYGTNAFANGNRLNGNQRWLVNMTQNQELSNRVSRWCYYNHRNIFARIYNRISERFCPGQISGPIYERRQRSFLRRIKIRKDLQYMKKHNVDLSVVLLHIGGQYNCYPLLSTKSQVVNLLRGGVNIVCGTHEHVTHDGIFNRIYANKIATYSLGNFNSMSGTFLPPFDQFSDYSVAWHVYINKDKKEIEKSTFTILKTLAMSDGKISVRLCHDLLNQSEQIDTKDPINLKQLLCDMQTVAFRFAGRRFTVDELTALQELPIA